MAGAGSEAEQDQGRSRAGAGKEQEQGRSWAGAETAQEQGQQGQQSIICPLTKFEVK